MTNIIREALTAEVMYLVIYEAEICAQLPLF